MTIGISLMQAITLSWAISAFIMALFHIVVRHDEQAAQTPLLFAILNYLVYLGGYLK